MVAFDDGPFSRRQRRAPLAAVVYTTPGSVDQLALGTVGVDGRDATEVMLGMLRAPGFGAGLRAVVLDGISVGGFNVVDLDRLARRSGLPVVSLTRRAPDLSEMRRAIRKYFPGSFRPRWSAVRAHALFPVDLGGARRFAAAVGCTPVEAAALLRRITSRGGWPEPLRIARLLAHAEHPRAPRALGAAPRPRRREPARRARL